VEVAPEFGVAVGTLAACSRRSNAMWKPVRGPEAPSSHSRVRRPLGSRDQEPLPKNVRRDGSKMRLYKRKHLTAGLSGIGTAASSIEAKTFTIDG
jgi:hypothetical protein